MKNVTFYFCPCCESEVLEYEGDCLEKHLKAEGWRLAVVEWQGDGVEWEKVEGEGGLLVCAKCAAKASVVLTLGMCSFGLARVRA